MLQSSVCRERHSVTCSGTSIRVTALHERLEQKDSKTPLRQNLSRRASLQQRGEHSVRDLENEEKEKSGGGGGTCPAAPAGDHCGCAGCGLAWRIAARCDCTARLVAAAAAAAADRCDCGCEAACRRARRLPGSAMSRHALPLPARPLHATPRRAACVLERPQPARLQYIQHCRVTPMAPHLQREILCP